MFKYRKKIDEKIAAKVVKYIAQTTITPNQVSTFSLLLAAFAAVFFSFGSVNCWAFYSSGSICRS